METLKQDEIDEIREVFERYDVEKSGWITVSMMGKAMGILGQQVTEAELYDLANENSTDGDGGHILFMDFLNVMAKRLEEQNSLETLAQAFRIFDRNDVDYFTMSEVKVVMSHLGEKISDEDLTEMLNDIDIDNDGKISFNEFVAAMRS